MPIAHSRRVYSRITEAAYEDYMATGDDSSLVRWYPILRGKTFSAFTDADTGLLHSGNAGEQGRTRYWSIYRRPSGMDMT